MGEFKVGDKVIGKLGVRSKYGCDFSGKIGTIDRISIDDLGYDIQVKIPHTVIMMKPSDIELSVESKKFTKGQNVRLKPGTKSLYGNMNGGDEGVFNGPLNANDISDDKPQYNVEVFDKNDMGRHCRECDLEVVDTPTPPKNGDKVVKVAGKTSVSGWGPKEEFVGVVEYIGVGTVAVKSLCGQHFYTYSYENIKEFEEPGIIIDPNKVTQGDLLNLLTHKHAVKIAVGDKSGWLSAIERESGDGRSFNLIVSNNGVKSGIFIRLQE